MKATKSRIITARLGLARLLWRVGMDKLGASVFPKLQGGADWGGAWGLGAGYTVTSTAPAYTFADPKYIKIGGTTVFHKMLVTLAGATRLFGKRNMFPTIELGIADLTTVANLCADPPVASTVTIVPPSGTTRTVTGRVVRDELGQIEPEGEIVRIIEIACSTVIS